tara:strand:- start:215 stop:484 length:270 start_codon:yes stop_codon:yes gene_type:complete
MPCENCDDKIYSKSDPIITIVKNPANDNFSITLQNWNSPSDADGYTLEEAKELMKMLEEGIVQLHNCWEEHNHSSLFMEDSNEEYSTTE